MSATDQTASEFMLPPVDTRSLVRRVAVPLALAGAAVVAVVVVGGRVPAVAAALRRGLDVNAGWVTLGVALEAISLAGYAALLSFIAGSASPRVRARESAQITLAGAAATRLLPTAGAGGAALTLWALRRAGMRPRAAVRTLLAFLVMLYAVFLTSIAVCGVVLSLGFVKSRGPGALSAIPAGAALVAIALGLALAHTARSAQEATADGDCQRPEDSSRLRSGGRLIGLAVRDACRLVRSGDPRLAGAIAYWGFDAGVLWAMLHAFGSPPVLPVLALAYLVGQVANTLPIPGSVSGGIAGVLIAFGVPAELALPSVLAYRTVAVWLPTPVAIAAIPGLRATIARWEQEDTKARVPSDSAPRHGTESGKPIPAPARSLEAAATTIKPAHPAVACTR
jgi:uncharacterized membrane protein YbhN (UPF0104 family)